MLTVIADDITGAAEMAGIGFRLGFRTSLLTEVGLPLPDCDVLVVATDTRSMTEDEAVAETRRVVRRLREAGAVAFFKKTDSALRGHVVPELVALLEETSYRRALYLPANPSKGRTIRKGIYYIDGTPLHETSFAQDPEFPATTSVVAERLPGIQRLEGHCLPPASESGTALYGADAESEEEIASLLASVKGQEVLLAGAADLFAACLAGDSPCRSRAERLQPFSGLRSGKAIVVCGSTLSASLASQPYIRRHGIPIAQMPREVFEGIRSASCWTDSLKPLYRQARAAVLVIGYPSKGGKDFAVRLRATMAEVTEALATEACPDEIVIEGGATAFSVLKRLGWDCFRLTDEVAPGVVRMCRADCPEVHVTLKPGSYPWGNLFA